MSCSRRKWENWVIGTMLVFLLVMAVWSPEAEAKTYWYVSIGMGSNTNATGASIEWDDAGGIGCTLGAGKVWELSNNWDVAARWEHISQCDKGPPFDDVSESSVDHFGLQLIKRFRIRR
jgi:hypothetical protein